MRTRAKILRSGSPVVSWIQQEPRLVIGGGPEMKNDDNKKNLIQKYDNQEKNNVLNNNKGAY